MALLSSHEDRIPIGQLWLRQRYGVRTPRPYTESYVVAGSRRTEVNGPRTVEYYGRSYLPDIDDIRTHLRFALRYEAIDLRLLVGAFKAMGPAPIRDWVREEPTGSYSRRAWFLYETFHHAIPELEDVRTGNYTNALDPTRHVVAAGRRSVRHRVVDNLLGDRDFCPTVRRTPQLESQLGLHVDAEARALIAGYDATTLTRAINYLYTKETRSSFAIEGEVPTPDRTVRFVAALRSADRFDPSRPASMYALQNQIVEPRYAASGLREFQNFVGSTTAGFREEVHFICPRPEDVPDMMRGWSGMIDRMIDTADPVVTAAVTAFGFVFVHPFEDGNGRIHRFLMHHILARTRFSPAGIIFPVSAAIAREQVGYDAILETFSNPLLKYIDWGWGEGQTLVVHNDTADLYRYFDATLFAEYLYDRVADTVRRDLRDELQFVAIFDQALEAITRIVDMPNRRAALFVKLCLQNGGRVSARKRDDYAELTDHEIYKMQDAIRDVIARHTDTQNGLQHDLFPTAFPDPSR